MSSGDANAPPTYYFTDITFNPSFYSTTTGDYLTATTGKNYFLSYPTAQGTETISTLKASSIDSSTTTTAFNFFVITNWKYKYWKYNNRNIRTNNKNWTNNNDSNYSRRFKCYRQFN